MVKQRVHALLTDYDGTLVATAYAKNPKANTVPNELEEILQKISSDIPVCVISTKDFEFLRKKIASAKILSCMMGIETLVLADDASSRILEKRLLCANLETLQANSRILEDISQKISSCEDFSNLIVESKYTSDGILAGLTFDWRHLGGWSHYRKRVAHFISRIAANLKKLPAPVDIYVQKYSEHPFIEVYSIECNKSIAFDSVIPELGYASIDDKGILYLGDSENDNPAFRKAGISIGIRYDIRVNPKLDCSYFLEYEQLSSFLVELRNNDYLFNDEWLQEAKRREQASS